MLVACWLAAAASAQMLSPEGAFYRVELRAELGALAPLRHVSQFGLEGTELDWVEEGGQGNLSPTVRPTAAVVLGDQRIVAVYQPLDLRSTEVFAEELVVEDTTFRAGRPVDLKYGFSFWRFSWQYLVVNRPGSELGFGLALQIRNADLGFTSVDGSRGEYLRDVGPVPILGFHLERRYDDGFVVGVDAEGFYAPGALANLRDVDVEGAIVDLQGRVGVAVDPAADVWLGLRWLGGGAEGTGEPEEPGDDGYVRDWLDFVAVTVGGTIR